MGVNGKGLSVVVALCAIIGMAVGATAPIATPSSDEKPASEGEARDMGNGAAYPGAYMASPYDSQYAAAAAPNYGPPSMPQYGATSYTDPGFSVQSGFEGFLVPNSWYGLLPWGVEGVVVAAVGVIAFIIISMVILGLLAWLTGFGDYAMVRDSARNLLPSHVNYEALARLTNSVLDALDKYDELQDKKNQ